MLRRHDRGICPSSGCTRTACCPPSPGRVSSRAGSTRRSGSCRPSPRTPTSTRGCCLFIQPHHYVTRLLHAGGVSLDRLGVGEGPLPEDRARAAWRLLCDNWHLLRGTPVRYWFDTELYSFGVRERPDEDNADATYDAARLSRGGQAAGRGRRDRRRQLRRLRRRPGRRAPAGRGRGARHDHQPWSPASPGGPSSCEHGVHRPPRLGGFSAPIRPGRPAPTTPLSHTGSAASSYHRWPF
jgi:hypothetical protein